MQHTRYDERVPIAWGAQCCGRRRWRTGEGEQRPYVPTCFTHTHTHLPFPLGAGTRTADAIRQRARVEHDGACTKEREKYYKQIERQTHACTRVLFLSFFKYKVKIVSSKSLCHEYMYRSKAL